MKRSDAELKYCDRVGGNCKTNGCMKWRDFTCDNCGGVGKYIPQEVVAKHKREAIAEDRDALVDMSELIACEHCDGTGHSDGGFCIGDDPHGHSSACKPERFKPNADGKIVVWRVDKHIGMIEGGANAIC